MFSRSYFSRSLKSDTFEYSGIKLIPPKQKDIIPYFYNNNADLTNLYRSDDDKQVADIIKYYRMNEESSIKLVNTMNKLCQNEAFDINNICKMNSGILRRLALICVSDCMPFPSKNTINYNPFDYHRIFRTIGESEYNALLNGNHIVSPSCNNESVMVTNNPKGVSACAVGKKYFVAYKDKPNFDILANDIYKLKENKIPYISSFNIENAEYYLVGGYNINDVESIIDSTKNIVYHTK